MINAWHAGKTGVGQGAYANRLIHGIIRHADFSCWNVTLLIPAPLASSFRERFYPLDVVELTSPRPANAVLDEIAWNLRLGAHRQAHDPGVLFFSPGSFWCLRAPACMATTHHDCINRHYPVYTGRRFIRRWAVGRSEKFLKRARVVLTQSEHAAADIQHLLGVPGDRLKVIPAWLPPEYSLQVARAAANGVRRKYGLPEHYWLYVGGYDVRKNVEFLIRAYAAARKTTPCPPLVLAGKIPGHTAPTLCDVHGALRDAGLSRDEVITPGFIDDADLPGLYGGAGLFLYPSLLEGYGLPPLEAMGCGCPALVADNSSLKEVVRDPEYRFNTADPQQLSMLLTRAAQGPIPVNPSFCASEHDEGSAIRRYFDVFASMVKKP